MHDLTVSAGDLIRAEDWNALVARLDSAAPPGTIVEWPTSTAPSGWVLCDGAPVPPGATALQQVLGSSHVPDRRAPVATLAARHAGLAGSGTQVIQPSAGYQNIGTSASFTKRAASSDVLVEWSCSAWCNTDQGFKSGGFGKAEGRIRLSGPGGPREDGQYPYWFNTTADHRHFGSSQRVSGLAAGSWTAQIQLRFVNPATNARLMLDLNDAFTIVVWEVQARNYVIKC